MQQIDTNSPIVVLSGGKLDISSCLLLLLPEGSVVTGHEEPSFPALLESMEETGLYIVSSVNCRTLFFH